MAAQSNRERIEADYEAGLVELHAQHEAIRAADAELRAMREHSGANRTGLRNMRLALFALDGDAEKTHADADAAVDEALEALREV